MFPEKAPPVFQQLIYRNVQPEQAAEGEACDEPKRYDRPCEQSCDPEEEEEPLMKTNNYQFCWVRPNDQQTHLTREQATGQLNRPRHHGPSRPAGQLQLFLLLFFLVLLFTSARQTDELPQHARGLLLCRRWLRLTNVDTEGGHMETNHTSVQCYLASDIPRSSSIYRFTVTFCLKGECSRLYYSLSPRSC